MAGSVFGFTKGDFNYDGLINGDDYFIIDSNIAFAQSQPPIGATGAAAVPEPSALLLLPLALLRRRRR